MNYSLRGKMINKLRQIMGNGNDMFKDSELTGFLQSSLEELNSFGKRTFYTLSTFPNDWDNTILLGAYVTCLDSIAESQK